MYYGYNYITSMSGISLLFHKTEGMQSLKLSDDDNDILKDITGFYPIICLRLLFYSTIFDDK